MVVGRLGYQLVTYFWPPGFLEKPGIFDFFFKQCKSRKKQSYWQIDKIEHNVFNTYRSQINSFWAKHTKISKDFACSMLILSIFSRALFQRNYAEYGAQLLLGDNNIKKASWPQKNGFEKHFLLLKILKFFGNPVTNFW